MEQAVGLEPQQIAAVAPHSLVKRARTETHVGQVEWLHRRRDRGRDDILRNRGDVGRAQRNRHHTKRNRRGANLGQRCHGMVDS